MQDWDWEIEGGDPYQRHLQRGDAFVLDNVYGGKRQKTEKLNSRYDQFGQDYRNGIEVIRLKNVRHRGKGQLGG